MSSLMLIFRSACRKTARDHALTTRSPGFSSRSLHHMSVAGAKNQRARRTEPGEGIAPPPHCVEPIPVRLAGFASGSTPPNRVRSASLRRRAIRVSARRAQPGGRERGADGVEPSVGLRPPYSPTPAHRFHPDCRASLILIDWRRPRAGRPPAPPRRRSFPAAGRRHPRRRRGSAV